MEQTLAWCGQYSICVFQSAMWMLKQQASIIARGKSQPFPPCDAPLLNLYTKGLGWDCFGSAFINALWMELYFAANYSLLLWDYPSLASETIFSQFFPPLWTSASLFCSCLLQVFHCTVSRAPLLFRFNLSCRPLEYWPMSLPLTSDFHPSPSSLLDVSHQPKLSLTTSMQFWSSFPYSLLLLVRQSHPLCYSFPMLLVTLTLAICNFLSCFSDTSTVSPLCNSWKT